MAAFAVLALVGAGRHAGPMRILTNVVIFVLIMAVSAVIALLSLDPLMHMGIFSSCLEGGCGYGKLLILGRVGQ